MSRYIHKSHNVNVLLYHIVCPAKYRKAVFTNEVERELRGICKEIAERYEIVFLEIGVDKDHVHFLVQSIPNYKPAKVVRVIKSITAIEIFSRVPRVKKELWGGEFWSKGYYITTVGKHGSESVIKDYVKRQGNDKYKRIYSTYQPGLFEK